ncbi:hypothetical protein MLD38_011861 [Melastoma candidum]|uniref:Uncharacterized protein n=1 Tax=Melastoma candidum TaxID=119954 RepID=A0ACB9R5I5_9MYRT|nr:hypothetical protein MLD38_011861 [Melastoma candidum]
MDETKNHNLDLISLAIQKLLEDQRATRASRDVVLLDSSIRDDGVDRCLLYQLLSQVESLKSSTSVGGPDPLPETVKDAVGEIRAITGDARNNGVAGIAANEIAKELRHVKRQNTITHWLLSAVIVVTVAWQLSEVTLILKVKESLSHPFRFVGKLASGFFKGKAPATEGDADDEKSFTAQEDMNGALPAIPPIKMPELPMIDLTNFPSKDDDSD